MKTFLTTACILTCTTLIAWADPLLTEQKPELENEAAWRGAEWISSTQKTAPQLAPEQLMGPRIAAAGTKSSGNTERFFSLDFQLPDKPVVYAGAWWRTSVPTETTCTVNGSGAPFSFRKNAPHYTDFSFCLRPGTNQIQLTLPNVPPDTAVSFGMQIVFDDGTEQIVQSSKHWETAEQSVETVCEYGKEPFGTAEVYSRAPLPAAWFKKDFELKTPVASARLYLCGLGYSEPYLNGNAPSPLILQSIEYAFPVVAAALSAESADSIIFSHRQKKLSIIITSSLRHITSLISLPAPRAPHHRRRHRAPHQTEVAHSRRPVALP